MSILNSLSAHIRALALYCRDSGQVPLSVCLFNDLMADSAWKILFSADCGGWLLRHFLGFSFVLAAFIGSRFFLLLWRAVCFCGMVPFGTWKDGSSSSLDWVRRLSSRMLEVSMFSSSIALELPGAAISPSDVSRFWHGIVGYWSGKTAVSTLSCGSLQLPIIWKDW